MEKQLSASPATLYSSGFIFLAIGVVLVVVHPVWTYDWRLLVTIIGWAVLFKGMLRIFFPEKVKALIEKKEHNRRFILAEIAVLVISLYLLYQGFLA